jgi:hypothetical protein
MLQKNNHSSVLRDSNRVNAKTFIQLHRPHY